MRIIALMLGISVAGAACSPDCPEGYLRDNDGNCLQVDLEAEGLADTGGEDALPTPPSGDSGDSSSGGDTDSPADTDPPETDPPEVDAASLFLCNPLQYSSGEPFEIELDCDGGAHLSAETGECSSCDEVGPGEVDCDVTFDGEDRGSLTVDVEEGDEIVIIFFLDDSGEVVAGGYEEPCGSDFDDLF